MDELQLELSACKENILEKDITMYHLLKKDKLCVINPKLRGVNLIIY